LWWHCVICRDDRGRLAAELNAVRLANDARLAGRDLEQEKETDAQHQQSGDWVEVEKRVSSAGHVDIAAVSTTEMELKRRIDKLSSMISEVSDVDCIYLAFEESAMDTGQYCFIITWDRCW